VYKGVGRFKEASRAKSPHVSESSGHHKVKAWVRLIVCVNIPFYLKHTA
jgi:hypothetical protein